MSKELGSTLGDVGVTDEYCVDSSEDIAQIEFLNLCEDDIYKLHFGELSVSYKFYNSHARARGFSVRKSKTRKNSRDEFVYQDFVCFCEGFRDAKYYNLENRIREPKVETRCGCTARI